MYPVIYVSLSSVSNIPPAQVPTFFTMFYTKLRLYQSTAANGTVSLNVYTQQMPIVPCSVALQNQTIAAAYQPFNTSSYFRDYGQLYGFCVQFNESETFVSGAGQQSTADIIAIQFYPCTLTPTTLCAPLATLRTVGILLTLPQPSLNLSNYEEPVKFSLSADNIFFVNEGAVQRYYQKLMITEIYDQSKYLFQQTLRTNITSIEKVVTNSRGRDATQLFCSKTSLLSTCSPYLEFQFISGSSKTKYYRSYRTLSQLLSQIGGIRSMALIVFVYINLIYNYYAKKILLVDRVFRFFKEAKTIDGKNRKVLEPIDTFQMFGSKHNLDKAKISLVNPLEDLDKRTLKKLKEEAYEVIMKNLDVITIVREINNLKVLTHLLFKNYHQKLMPIISLNIQCRQDAAEKKLKEMEESSKKKAPLAKPLPGNSMPGSPPNEVMQMDKVPELLEYEGFQNNDGGKITVEAAFKQLCREVGSVMEAGVDKQLTLEEKVDVFCCKNLEDAYVRGLEKGPQLAKGTPAEAVKLSTVAPNSNTQKFVLQDTQTAKSAFEPWQIDSTPVHSPTAFRSPQAMSPFLVSNTSAFQQTTTSKLLSAVKILQRNEIVKRPGDNRSKPAPDDFKILQMKPKPKDSIILGDKKEAN